MDDAELVKEFLVESHENLDQLDQDILTLEADPNNPESLARVFRVIHTIKGTCGFLGFTKLEWVTHVGENLLSRLRDGELSLNAEITTALLSLVDAVRQILDSIESHGNEGDTDYDALVSTLTRLQEGPVGAAEEPGPGTEQAEASPTAPDDTGPPATESADASGEPDTGISQDQHAGADDSRTPDVEVSQAVVRIDRRIERFLMESYEHADQLDQDLVTLESEPTNQALLSRILGTLHTLKSSSGFMGFTATESATHAGETLLGALRDGKCQLDAAITTALLSLVDMVRQALVAIETTGDEQGEDYAAVVATIKRLTDGSRDAESRDDPIDAPTTDAPCSDAIDSAAEPGIGASKRPTASGAVPTEGQVGAKQTPQSSKAQVAAATPPARDSSVAEASIRVDVGLLDMLMDQIGELVLARNQILQLGSREMDRGVIAAYQRLDLITSELQEGVMKTRMQPIGTIWNKFPRLVRDLARDCGKQVVLRMEGEDTELDRTLIEAIRDPLTHLVRNAIDHGIESPQTRRQSSKPETGNLYLRAFHESGQVIIGITDDGGGIDPQRIASTAVSRNLISSDQADQMSEREILNLIFAPGFSTAQTVTNVSGRGVGMDVVKNNIEKINGTIDVQSEVGSGSTIKIKIPLTLAIIPALVVRSAGDRYAIPQASLIELVRLEGDHAHTKIEHIHGAPVYRLRGRLLPLVFLKDELSVEQAAPTGSAETDRQIINIVVLQADRRQFGLVVDHVLDTEEIVVKPLGAEVKDIATFAGATIMGDGNVALILDILGLAQRANVVSKRREAMPTEKSAEERETISSSHTLLLFETPSGQRLALPLSRVTRLERFALSDVERSGKSEVVQYWGQVMPLIDVSRALAGCEPPTLGTESMVSERDTREVVVLTLGSQCIGLVVDRILDTVEEVQDVQPLKSRHGISGTVVVDGQVTELLDLEELIRMTDPGLLSQLATPAMEG